MPIVGDWWTKSQRPILKQGRGVTADVEQADVASCAVATAGIASCNVTSEKASASLRRNSVLVFLEAATSTEAAGQVTPCSTANAVWRPGANVDVLAVTRFSLALEEMATCDNFVLYGNAGTCIGGVVLSAGTTNPAAYTRTCSGALTQTALAAGTNVLIQRLSSTCSRQGRSAFQIDYESTG